MGMFDKPKFLTGTEEGYAEPGDTFWLHNARIDGTTSVGGETRPQVKLQVSRTKDGDKEIVYTSGRGITAQVQRMDAEDRAAFPMEVRLDQIAPKVVGNKPTYVLTPSNLPPASASGIDGGTPDF